MGPPIKFRISPEDIIEKSEMEHFRTESAGEYFYITLLKNS